MMKTCLLFAAGVLVVTGIAQGQNLYVSSSANQSVFEYNGSSGAYTRTFVPAGTGLERPHGLIFGPDGNLYVSSFQNNSVLKYDRSTGALLGAFVPAGSGGLIAPEGLIFGPDGNLYVSGFGNNSVLRYNGSTGAFLDVFVPFGSGGLDAPVGLTFGPDGNLYVSSYFNHRVLRYNGITGVSLGDFVPAGSGGLDLPEDLIFGPDGNLYVSDLNNASVLKYDGSSGDFAGVFVSRGSGGLRGPVGLTFGPDGNLYVSSYSNSNVLQYDGSTGKFLSVFVQSPSGGLAQPTFLVFSPAPPTIAKSFGALSIPLNGITTLNFTVTNIGAKPLTATGFTDTLPTGLVVATSNGLSASSGCGGATFLAASGFGTVSMSGATIARGVSCMVSVNVTGTTPGEKNNSVTVSDAKAGPGNTATAKLTVMAPPTELAFTAATATTSDFHDAATVQAKLTSNGTPVPGKTIVFTLNGAPGCSGVTDATGTATCSLTPSQPAAAYALTAAFAGDSTFGSSSVTAPFMVTQEEAVTKFTATSPTLLANGSSATFSATLKEDGTTAISGRTLTFTLGSGAAAQSCTGTTDSTGTAMCIIAVNQPLGPNTVTANFAGEAFYKPSSDSKAVTVFAFVAGGGSFVIGDRNAVISNAVEFWGAQWAKDNSLSGGSAPNSFKGFAAQTSPMTPACGGSWTSDPGNSSNPPASVPSYLAVIASSVVGKSGSSISGNISKIVVVRTNSGYAPNPGRAGTGTVLAVLCGQ